MPLTKEQQHFFMTYALSLGEKGRYSAPPNPWVGCVIVKEGAIVGEGYHEERGKPHAEIIALQKAGKAASGATCFITLEPCSHFGKTPPCVDALIEAGIAQVVIPFADPDPHVNGKGIERLQKAGVEVILGVADKEAAYSLEPYLFQRKNKRPYCVLKAAISIDGRTAAADGSSQWITGEKARENVQLLRAESQAILVGTRTALIDSPKLTARHPQTFKNPLRVVLDRTGKLSKPCPLLDTSLAPTLIFTTKQCPQTQIVSWLKHHVEVEIVEEEEGKINLEEVLAALYKRDIIQLLVEGGSIVQSHFLERHLLERCVFYVGNCLLGPAASPLFCSLPSPSVQQAVRWRLLEVRRFEEDVRLDYAPLV